MDPKLFILQDHNQDSVSTGHSDDKIIMTGLVLDARSWIFTFGPLTEGIHCGDVSKPLIREKHRGDEHP